MRLLLLDNYDSFTYNLYDYLYQADPQMDISVHRNDRLTVQAAIEDFDAFVLSPGPGLPQEAGIMMPLLEQIKGIKPCLGVCLGMQAIAMAYGGRLYNLEQPFHGVSRQIRITQNSDPLWKEIPETFDAGRYHSWVVDQASLPDHLLPSSVDDTGLIMSLYVADTPLHAVQFHPESIMTPFGLQMIRNFIEIAKKHC